MSNWKTEIENKHEIEMFLCGQTSDLTDNDKKIILDLVAQLENEDVELAPTENRFKELHLIENFRIKYTILDKDLLRFVSISADELKWCKKNLY